MSLPDRLRGHGVSADRLEAIGLTDSTTEAETAAVAAVTAAAAVQHDAAALDAYVKYIGAANAFERSKIRQTVGNDILAKGRSLLGGR